jgi:hypothetical protein
MVENHGVGAEASPKQVGKFLMWTAAGLLVVLLAVLLILLLTGHKLPMM